MSASNSKAVVRFSFRQRVEHFSVMSIFTLLALTGFPQKFADSSWAAPIVRALGGLDVTRAIHRTCGILFSVLVVIHLGTVAWVVLTGRARPSLVPIKKDFTDAIRQIRWYLGLEPSGAIFDRFDYRQKFEYWGLVMGGMVMVSTGFILYLPMLFTRFLPGEIIPASKVAHSNEGLMAFLVVIVWHVFNAHFSPDVFPFDPGIFTGKIPRERMLHEHPLELARIEGKPVDELLGEAHGASHAVAPAEGAGEGEPPPKGDA